jgi:hypothetical protein
MTKMEEIKRRIELKRQLIELTKIEIEMLEDELKKEATASNRKSGNPIHLPL